MPLWLEVVLRTLAAVSVLFILTKLLGKRQLSELSLFEYITGISIGNMAGYVSLDTDSLWYIGLIAIGVWFGVSIGMEYLTMKNKKIGDFVDGKAAILIQNGQLLKKQLKKEKLTVDELLMQLRKKDVYRVADVEFAVMEPSGELNVLLKKQFQPITPDLLGWKVGKEHVTKSIILDGEVMYDVLAESGHDEKWLNHELTRLNLKKEDVLLAQIDSNGKLQIQTADERQLPEERPMRPQDRIAILTEHFEAELLRLERLARNESDRRIYQTAIDRFQGGREPHPEPAPPN